MKAYVTDRGDLMLIPETDKDDQFLASLAKAENPHITAQIIQCKHPHLSHVTIALQEPQPSALPYVAEERDVYP